MLEIGTQLQGRYAIEEQIGRGGMGTVYLAVDHKFSISNRVAIKETFHESPELADAFEREARLLNSLHHPILPHVSDYFTEGAGNFLVMEYIEGEDLSEKLRRDGAFPLGDVVRWTQEILDGLDYLHSQEPPVIHRDIKPNNLKLTSRGFIVLLDFGLAKEDEDVTLGERSIFGYSRRYSPLEQIEGVGSDARSDLFSLGATVFHLLTAKPPVDALARASAIVAGQPDPLQLASELNPEIPESVARVLHSALALNADQRFASAKAMSAALQYAVDPGAAAAAAQDNLIVPPFPTVDETAGAAEVVAFPALQAFKADIGQDAPELVQNEPVTDATVPEAAVDVTEELHESIPPVDRHETPMGAIVASHGVHELGAVDQAPAAYDPQPLEPVRTDAYDETELTQPVAAERAPNNPSATIWRNPGVWLLLILVGLFAVVYGVSGLISSDADTAAKAEAAASDLPSSPAAGTAAPAAADPAPAEDEIAAEPSASKNDAVKEPAPAVLKASPSAVTRDEPSSVGAARPDARTRTSTADREARQARNQSEARQPDAPLQDTRAARRSTRSSEQREPVSRIEDVFTGISPQEARRIRRGEWEVLTWEEERELRRERRRRRQQRQQNAWPF